MSVLARGPPHHHHSTKILDISDDEVCEEEVEEEDKEDDKEREREREMRRKDKEGDEEVSVLGKQDDEVLLQGEETGPGEE